MSIAERLSTLGIALPPAPRPVAAYVPAVRSGDLIFVSGQIPMVAGALTARGPVPSSVGVEAATAAARQCALNALAVLADALGGDLDQVARVVRLGPAGALRGVRAAAPRAWPPALRVEPDRRRAARPGLTRRHDVAAGTRRLPSNRHATAESAFVCRR